MPTQSRAFRMGFHVKSLCLGGVAGDKQGAVVLACEERLMGGAETSPHSNSKPFR